MAIGERIHHFRLLRGFTQKYLGQQLGFSESQADVRIAQYEKGARSPKENYLNALADIFDVSPHALAVPDIDSYVGLMHTLFTLEVLLKNINRFYCISLSILLLHMSNHILIRLAINQKAFLLHCFHHAHLITLHQYSL